ncbi:hypothetical protein NSS82_19135 [Paenibacillus sp. FSL H7-0735]|uniref:hypothetical protein n=1 Tax=Paenibacillus sp. FSL H7-0735 TaxID=2954736 RepID=UPI0030F7E929
MLERDGFYNIEMNEIMSKFFKVIERKNERLFEGYYAIKKVEEFLDNKNIEIITVYLNKDYASLIEISTNMNIKKELKKLLKEKLYCNHNNKQGDLTFMYIILYRDNCGLKYFCLDKNIH